MSGYQNKKVFTVDCNSFEVCTQAASSADADDAVWAQPAEIEEIGCEVDNSVENWTPFGQDGWQSALLTGKALKLSIKGKRVIGDPGNDAIADKQLKVGADAYLDVRLTAPNGDKLVITTVCDVKKCGSDGKATDVAPLEADLNSHGKPVFTAATKA